MKIYSQFIICLIATAAFVSLPATGHSAKASPGAVFTMSNSADNYIFAYDRGPDGQLAGPSMYPTNGSGSGGGLGNQGGLLLTPNRNWLLAVNAGSDSVSVFRVKNGALELTDVEGSQGTRPISLTIDHNLVYVLNAGSDSIAGFVLTGDGDLIALDGSSRPLSGAGVGSAQVSFSPSGNHLVVTEKATNLISVYSVGENGYASLVPVSTLSAAPTPFGFSFAKDGLLVVSEANGGSPTGSFASTYLIGDDDSLVLVDGAVATTEAAACWILLGRNDKFAYTTNTASGTISGFSIAKDGSLELLQADGISAVAGAGPIDMAQSGNGKFLYSLNGADDSISAFAIGNDGSLTPIGTTAGVPGAANGLAAY